MRTDRVARLVMLATASLLTTTLACSKNAPSAPAPELPPAGEDGTYEVKLPEPQPAEARTIFLDVGADLKRCDVEDPHFPYAESEVEATAIPQLKHLANCLTAEPFADVDLRLIGRADPRGSEEYNQNLAKERANYVKDKLVEYGVPASRIEVASRGEAGALGDTDKASYEYDRRVDIVQLQVIHP